MMLSLTIIAFAALLLLLILEERRHLRMRKLNEDAREELLSTAHQLRSPLANLRKFNTALLSRQFGKLTLAQQEIIGKMHLSLAESFIGIDRLLVRAHLEEGMIGVAPGVVSVRESVDAALTAVKAKAERKNISITVAGGEEAHVYADVLLLHGIFNELLLNAIDYTPQGGSAAVRIRKHQNNVTVTIEDSGVGIPDDERSAVFQKFFRGQHARFLSSGSGLGLWFVKESVTKMGGDVTFETGHDRGTAFIVTLPRAIQEEAMEN